MFLFLLQSAGADAVVCAGVELNEHQAEEIPSETQEKANQNPSESQKKPNHKP